MRWFVLVVEIGLFAPSVVAADPGQSGGGAIPQPPPGVVDPGFCWGGGVIPQPPPGGEIEPPVPSPGGEIGPPGESYGPTDMAPGDTEITPVYGVGVGPMFNAAAQAATPLAAAGAEPAGASGGRLLSQRYIPPAVWRWVAEHPVSVD
jgi:hypothetical protein